MSRNPHILVLDSGVGGLSVAKEILAAHPQCRLTYASDNAYFPYGTKPIDALLERVNRVVGKLIESVHPDVVVIACNTASTITLPRLRESHSVPFVGVVPAIKPAALMTRTGVVGLLATPATVERAYTHQLIQDHAGHCDVLLYGSRELVHQAENKLQGLPVDQAVVANELGQLTKQKRASCMDTIVLACTHFPLLRTELEVAAGDIPYQWVDSGLAIARRVGYWIGGLAAAETAYCGEYHVILTAASPSWQSLRKNLPNYFGEGAEVSLRVLPIA